jgi:hypothetical protein
VKMWIVAWRDMEKWRFCGRASDRAPGVLLGLHFFDETSNVQVMCVRIYIFSYTLMNQSTRLEPALIPLACVSLCMYNDPITKRTANSSGPPFRNAIRPVQNKVLDPNLLPR